MMDNSALDYANFERLARSENNTMGATAGYPSAINLQAGLWLSGALLAFLVAGLFDYALIISATKTLVLLLDLLPGGFVKAVSFVQPTLFMASLVYRVRVAGPTSVAAAFRDAYRDVLGGLKVWFVLIEVCPALIWYVTIDCVCGPGAQRRIALLILQITLSSVTGFWNDTAEQFAGIFESNGTAQLPEPSSQNATWYESFKTITWQATKSTVTYVPIESVVLLAPAMLLMAQRALPHLFSALSVPVAHWIAAAEQGWTWVLKRIPGHHPIDPDEVDKALNPMPPWAIPRLIRLLRVQPGLFDDKVYCSLEWYNLDGPHPPYAAISYVWGSPKRDRLIVLDGKRVPVTTSAATALRSLRSQWYARLFWIDALCIDQDDPLDKSRQIPFMADIYHRARNVHVWLGLISYGSLTLSAVRELWVRAMLHTEFGGPAPSFDDMPAAVWVNLKALLRRPWFERTWTVQEVVVARNADAITIHYGDGSIDWQTLSWFIRSFRSNNAITYKLSARLDFDVTRDNNMAAVRNLDAVEDFAQLYIHGGRNMSLLFHLVRMFRTGCSRLAVVDYLDPKPVRIFIDAAIHFLHDARVHPKFRLDFLAHAGLECSSKLPLPLWVPDWTVSELPSTPFLGLEGFHELFGNDEYMIYRYCNATAEMKTYGDVDSVTSPMHKDTMKALQARVIDLRKAFYKAGLPGTEEAHFEVVRIPSRVLLKITGHSVGHIMHLGTPFGPVGINDKMHRDGSTYLNPAAFLPLDWRPLADEHGRYLRLPIASLCEAFARTLVGDLSQTQFDMKVDDGAPVRPTRTAIAEFIASYEEVLAKYFRKPTPLEDLFSTLDSRWAYDIRFLLRANSVIRPVCAGRVFGITDQGLMDLFPHGTQIGDAVAVFYGAPVPFTLRPYSRHPAACEVEGVRTLHESALDGGVHYQLVGPCYVHGIMDGEALEGCCESTHFVME
ncbi:Folylpolyglutamate synthetase [Madurella fahalii]|uniref:Folylpolyglutamate synthetase n=1 Tax=Madurella fahalii TaxID=1157608 RepID=A0ABQ0GGN6_9PEZI